MVAFGPSSFWGGGLFSLEDHAMYTVFFKINGKLDVRVFETPRELNEWFQKEPVLEDLCQGNGLRAASGEDITYALAGNMPDNSMVVINGRPIKLKRKQMAVLYALP
jgi:hypothetical protein